MKEIDYIILRKLINGDVRISQKHKDIMHRLTLHRCVEYVNGDWVVTDEGIKENAIWGNSDTDE